MSDTESDFSSPTRWDELYQLIIEPGVVARALEPTSGLNEATSVRVGNPVSLIGEAERAGGGRAIWAVVAPLRRDWLMVDIDRCADQVFSHIVDAADDVGAVLAYLAASGSPDSLHVAFACPTVAARSALSRTLSDFGRWAQLEPGQSVDVFTERRMVRLPGSISLKGEGFCRPVDVDGKPITAVAAVHRARQALDTTAEAAGSPATAPLSTVRQAPKTAAGRTVAPVGDDPGIPAPMVEAPRAWRRRTRLPDAVWRLLNSKPVAPYRSDEATKAAWSLWRHGIRSWAYAKWWYTNCSVFAKFADRDAGRDPEATEPGACQLHWESIAARATGYKPEIPAADQQVIDTVREQIAQWTDAPAAALAALAVLEHRFTDGYGIEARPVSMRCLSQWLNIPSLDRVAALRHELVRRGILTEVSPSAAREATRFTLTAPATVSSVDPEHNVTPQGLSLTQSSPLSPLWGLLSAPAWQVHTLLSPTGQPLAVLAHSAGLPRGDARHGCGRLLHLLAEHGLAERVGHGRGTLWRLGPTTPTAATAPSGALERWKALRMRINAERSVWHAETRREQGKAKRVLIRVLDRLRTGNRPADQLVLLGAGWSWGDSSSASVNAAAVGPRRRRSRRDRPPSRTG